MPTKHLITYLSGASTRNVIYCFWSLRKKAFEWNQNGDSCVGKYRHGVKMGRDQEFD